MKFNLLLAGAGHAHLETLAHLDAFTGGGYQAAVIGPSAYHYYSGMGPGMLGGFYRPGEIRFNIEQMVGKKGGTFIRGKVAAIDATARVVRLESGDEISYDVLSCNLGSQVSQGNTGGPMDDIFPVKPIERLIEARRRTIELGCKKPISAGIIGGGPSAVEIAGNLRRLERHEGLRPVRIQILTQGSLLADYPHGVRKRALSSLRRREIELMEACEVKDIQTGHVTETTGETHEFDLIFIATGVKPGPVFRQSNIPAGPDGGMRVNRFLQSTGYPKLFGGGDCIHFEDSPLAKAGVYAVRQNPVLCHNLMAALKKKPLRVFHPGGDYLLIFNLGDGTGIFHKRRVSFNGRLAFIIKDYIDRKFMKRYQ